MREVLPSVQYAAQREIKVPERRGVPTAAEMDWI